MNPLFPKLITHCRKLGWSRTLALCLMLAPLGSRAQWLTQSIDLTNGWNAVYLHVDASHASLVEIIGSDPTSPILEIWQWRPAPSTLQFVEGPQSPIDTGSQWASWKRESPGSATLQRLPGNTAYLVRLSQNVSSYTWNVRGKPLPPAYNWTTTGLNFLGFPTPASQSPTFEEFLAKAPDLRQQAEIYQYTGGDLNAANPARVFAFRNVAVRRGQAFWIRSATFFNRYFGPFEISLAGLSGVEYGENSGVKSLRIRNLTDNQLTVTLRLIASEVPPNGQPAIQGVPPLLVRGELNTNDFSYTSAPLDTATARAWTLAAKGQPGSEAEIILGLNRSAMTGAPGQLYAAVLQLIDSLGLSQVDVPISASVAPSTGLWVGRALVTEVGAYLKTYQRDAENEPVTSADGAYVVTATNTSLGSTAKAFPLQLILHNPETGNALLLQRAYFGFDATTNVVVANQESALSTSFLDSARRVSVSHLPWTKENLGWSFDGNLSHGGDLTAAVVVAHDEQASNPFLHSYHPDHDNRDAFFRTELAQGSESYTIRREITLRVKTPGNDFTSLTASGQNVQGEYLEAISVLGLNRGAAGTDTRRFEVRGAFTLKRLLGVPNLTTNP